MNKACNICDNTGWEKTKNGVIRCKCTIENYKKNKLKKIPKYYLNANFLNLDSLSIPSKRV